MMRLMLARGLQGLTAQESEYHAEDTWLPQASTRQLHGAAR